MARILILSFSDFTRDPRPARQISALAGHHEVNAAGFGAAPPGVAAFTALEHPDGRLNKAAGLARIASRSYRHAYRANQVVRSAHNRLDGTSADLVIANDVHTLPLALEVADGAPVLFDAHEYYPEHFVQVPWWRVVMAPYFEWMCREFMPRAAAVTTVSPGLARLYHDRLGVNAEVITNASPRALLEPSPVGERVRLIHHGLADRHRRLETMIEAVRALDHARFSLDLMLVGSDAEIERLRHSAGDDPRIGFLPPVPMADIPRAINGHDVGLFLLEPRTPNQRHVLPNKLFEFIQARLAVAIGPSPDMAEVVRSRGLGVVAAGFGSADFARALGDLDAGAVEAMKAASHEAARDLNAEANVERLTALVDGLLSG